MSDVYASDLASGVQLWTVRCTKLSVLDALAVM